MRNAALEIREEAESTSRFTQITAAANYTSVVMYYLFIFDLQYFLEIFFYTNCRFIELQGRKCSLGKEIVFRLKIMGDTCLD